MSQARKNLGLGALALVPIVCCVGLPLLLAAGISVAAFTVIGGISVGALVLGAAIALIVIRARRRRACATPTITNVPRRT